MFDSILERAFPGLEILVVDDCSDEPCADIIDAYGEKGLAIRLIRHEERRYTKQARLTGIRAALGKYICFADADDVLWGDCLHKHVMLMEANAADVLHFNAIFINADYSAQKLCHWTVPHGTALHGQDIFAAFVDNNPAKGPSVWCRMFSRELCMKVAPVAAASKVLRYGEDLLLTTLLLFHAERYLGSGETGYGYRWQPDKAERAPGRLATAYYILTEIAPYMEKHGCPPELLKTFKRHIAELMRTWADKLAVWLTDETGRFDEEGFNSMFCNAGSKEFVKILTTCRWLELRQAKEECPAKSGQPSFGKRVRTMLGLR